MDLETKHTAGERAQVVCLDQITNSHGMFTYAHVYLPKGLIVGLH